MSIEIQCPDCQAIEHVHARFRGKRVRCPHCIGMIDVPMDAVDVEVSDGVSESEVVATEVASDPATAVVVEATSEVVAIAKSPTLVTGSTLHPTVAVANDEHAPGVGLEFEDEDPPKRKKREEGELDMTPMVDVTFLLLIFFMVTASFSLQKSIQMPRQQSDAPSSSPIEEETEELDSVEVQIDEFGSFLVLAPDWERETPGKQNLISALKDALGGLGGGGGEGIRLAIKVHEEAKLQALVDCMDAGTIAGFAELQVTQVEEFE